MSISVYIYRLEVYNAQCIIHTNYYIYAGIIITKYLITLDHVIFKHYDFNTYVLNISVQHRHSP